MLENKYGYFSENGREYIIKNPLTPRPWINVISNGDYSFMISQTGGGCSWRGNAAQNRITRLYQDIIKDNWGKYFYLRDLDKNDLWSLTYMPVKSSYQDFSVRHGVGYSIFEFKRHDIRTIMKVFVVAGAPLEIIDIKVINEGGVSKNLDLTSYFEWEASIHPDEHREFNKLFMDTSYDKNLKAIKLKKYHWGFPDKDGLSNNVDWDFIGFHACSEEVKSFDTDKESFIGMYNNEEYPLGLKQDKLSGKEGRFGDAIAALQTPMVIEPGDEKRIVFTIGAASIGKDEINNINQEAEDVDGLIQKYTNIIASDEAFKNLQIFWDELLNGDEVNTPDDSFNLMTNTFAKYQAISCRLWGKTAYYQTSGGYGFRDQLQDSLVFLEAKPELTKAQLKLHAKHQFIEGDVYHWFVTYQGWGPRSNCSDDLLWMPLVMYYYLEETLDYGFLLEEVPYLDGPSESMYNHSKKAIKKALTRYSKRGVPLMGSHDWNDGLNAVGHKMKGESFWMSSFLYLILNQFSDIANYMEDESFSKECLEHAEKIKKTFEEFGWDGKWYLQATNDDGEKIGSNENEEGKIFLMPNAWAIISKIIPEEKIEVVIKSIEKYLLKDYGTLLNYPAFTKPVKNIGYVTRYAPGLRENGGVYTHAATWAVTAFAEAGYPELAYKAYKGICPPNRTKDPDVYLAEPYVTCGNSDGPLSPLYGRGGWSWYTGSAQWLHRVAVQDIIGIKASFKGLVVEPNLPSDWNHVTYKRKFRNATYIFEIIRNGEKKIIFDGVKLENNIVPDCQDGLVHHIVVSI
ncbi:MAG: GH116 family glycosyl hydrolase [Candidatus Izemoplasmatales bacterium]|nr:GH116 family glycosyl hydrolase [Candidatus Izemoplasmatales bacterium]